MNKASWGTKRNCPACTADFYDLNHVPAVCPKCKHEFDPAAHVRTKRKVSKRPAEDSNVIAMKLQAAIAKKAGSVKKQKKDADDDDTGDAIGALMELDDADDIENIHELSELEEMEEEIINEDDADEEALIEGLDTAGNVIVSNPEDEEIIELTEEEPAAGTKKKKSKK